MVHGEPAHRCPMDPEPCQSSRRGVVQWGEGSPPAAQAVAQDFGED